MDDRLRVGVLGVAGDPPAPQRGSVSYNCRLARDEMNITLSPVDPQNASSPTDDVVDSHLVAFVTAAVCTRGLSGTGEEPFHNPYSQRPAS